MTSHEMTGVTLGGFIQQRNKGICSRIMEISALAPSLFGPYCGKHLIPFMNKNEKDRPIKHSQASLVLRQNCFLVNPYH